MKRPSSLLNSPPPSASVAFGSISSEPSMFREATAKILLVDDDPRTLMAMESLLAGPGRAIHTARSGHEALRQLLQHDFALILLDVRMPEMDGYETAALIRQRERSRYVPIIFLSAIDTLQTDVIRAVSSGAVDYLFKPVIPDVLKAKVSVFVDLFSMNEQLKRKAIQQSEQRFRLLVESMRDYAIFMLDPEGRVTSWNTGAERIEGFQQHEIIGEHFSCFYTPEDQAEKLPAQALLHAATEGRYEHEGWRARKDGSRFWANTVISALLDEQDSLVGFSVVTRDLTHRKRVEGLIVGQKQVLEQIARSAPLGTILATICRTAEEQTGNDSLSSIFLLQDGLYLRRGAGPSLPDSYHQAIDGTPIAPQAVTSAVAAHKKQRVFTPDIAADSGWAEHAQLFLSLGLRAGWSMPIFSSTGKVLGTFDSYFRQKRLPTEREREMIEILARTAGIAIERQQADQALRQSEEKLRQQAQELEQQLIVSGRLVSLGQITASMAHEFNNPLGIIMGFVEDMLSGIAPNDPNYRSLKIIDEETKRCARIVKDLMEYARPTRADFCSTHVAEIIEKTLHLVENHLYKQKVALRKDLQPDLPRIYADPQQLEQVLVNLFLNAIDAMPEGGELTVQTGLESAESITPSLVITVTDTGIGIEDDHLHKIFQPFYTAKKRRGLGLGLPICERIVKNHGGRIAVHSQAGKGTTFALYLPLEQRGDGSTGVAHDAPLTVTGR